MSICVVYLIMMQFMDVDAKISGKGKKQKNKEENK